MIPIFFAAADGGVAYDIIFALALVLTFLSLNNIFYDESKNVFWFFLLGLGLSLGDLARPFFILPALGILSIFYIFSIIKGSVNTENVHLYLIPLLTFFILVTPFHIVQYKNTSSIVLSNYGGCNLSEVFNVETPFDLDRGKLNSSIYTEECNRRKNIIFNELTDNPNALLLGGRLESKLKHVLFPPLAWYGSTTFTSDLAPYFQDFFHTGIFFIYLFL